MQASWTGTETSPKIEGNSQGQYVYLDYAWGLRPIVFAFGNSKKKSKAGMMARKRSPPKHDGEVTCMELVI